MKRFVFSMLFICLSLSIFAQASGGQIRRGKTSTKVTAKSSYINNGAIIRTLISNMVYVQGGTLAMGATKEQGELPLSDEKPMHYVTLSSFNIGKYEVTQEIWIAIMGSNPSYFKGNKRPVENVSWEKCQEFIRRLNSMTGKCFRLPTEAEWEYAARGGRNSQHLRFPGTAFLNDVAWYKYNSDGVTHNVGQKNPNELGLYDMSGNVWEWCQDWWDSYDGSSQIGPKGPSSGFNKIFRGGGYDSQDEDCRVSRRSFLPPEYYSENLGFRLVMNEE